MAVQTTSEKRDDRILVGISGGVDSAVAVALLKSEGHRMMGLHLKLDSEASRSGFQSNCIARSNEENARKICAKLDIPLKILDASEVFEAWVIDPSVHEYLRGRKPNPCVFCNQRVKLAVLDDYAARNGFSRIATGHFAQITLEPRTGAPRLQKATESSEDQSYYIYGTPTETLARTLMPLGGISKAMVRKLAVQFNIPEPPGSAHALPECFPGGPERKAFIEKRTVATVRARGIIRTQEGKVLGEHEGLHLHTIGDKRLSSDRTPPPPQEEYVVEFQGHPSNMLVGPESLLYRNELYATDARWIRPPEGIKGLRCKARVRRNMKEAPCHVTFFENHVVHVSFDEPVWTIIPGQAVVFYDGDEILGGATIERAPLPAPAR